VIQLALGPAQHGVDRQQRLSLGITHQKTQS
jgi:hypothetical protein